VKFLQFSRHIFYNMLSNFKNKSFYINIFALVLGMVLGLITVSVLAYTLSIINNLEYKDCIEPALLALLIVVLLYYLIKYFINKWNKFD
jgi:hypothetical protein